MLITLLSLLPWALALAAWYVCLYHVRRLKAAHDAVELANPKYGRLYQQNRRELTLAKTVALWFLPNAIPLFVAWLRGSGAVSTVGTSIVLCAIAQAGIFFWHVARGKT